jgi:hypothetical protein
MVCSPSNSALRSCLVGIEDSSIIKARTVGRERERESQCRRDEDQLLKQSMEKKVKKSARKQRRVSEDVESLEEDFSRSSVCPGW